MPVTGAAWHCSRCGVESLERACFVIPGPHEPPPHDIRCVTCERVRQARQLPWRFVTFQLCMLLPFVAIAAHSGQPFPQIARAAALLVLLYPVAMLVHELGHLLTARLCGLEVGGLNIGLGRRWWAGEIFGIPVRIRAWPMAGWVYLGGFRLAGLRARIWLATLMGPGANAAMVWVTIAAWDGSVEIFGVAVLMAWIYVNTGMALGNLVPFQGTEDGMTYSSDGRSLIRGIRGEFNEPAYRTVGPLVRAISRIEARAYAQAVAACEEGLRREPDGVWLSLLLAVSRYHLLEVTTVLQMVGALLARPALPPLTRAYIQQLGVLAGLVAHAGAAPDDPRLLEIERLSAGCFSAFPCVLAIRSARALVLLARGQPERALTVLEFVHYGAATPVEAGDREAARYCAYLRLERAVEARHALRLARRLHPESLEWVERMRLVAAASVV